MNRYPELNDENIDILNPDKSIIIPTLRNVFVKLIESNSQLQQAVSDFIIDKTVKSLQVVCNLLFIDLPMQTNKVLNPLISTQEQLNRFLANDYVGYGNCKILTIVTAYICNILAGLPTVISIRKYSEHPVLYLDIEGGVQKISFLHELSEVKQFKGKNPFSLTSDVLYNPNFIDIDFQKGKSILYWKILEAIFILDCINILRRCVVNYAFDPEANEIVFLYVIDYLVKSGIYVEPVANYWEDEFDRVKQLYLDPRSPKNPSDFKKAMETSLHD